jgi:hypothetical protein
MLTKVLLPVGTKALPAGNKALVQTVGRVVSNHQDGIMGLVITMVSEHVGGDVLNGITVADANDDGISTISTSDVQDDIIRVVEFKPSSNPTTIASIITI